jgi:hypothetical protein
MPTTHIGAGTENGDRSTLDLTNLTLVPMKGVGHCLLVLPSQHIFDQMGPFRDSMDSLDSRANGRVGEWEILGGSRTLVRSERVIRDGEDRTAFPSSDA